VWNCVKSNTTFGASGLTSELSPNGGREWHRAQQHRPVRRIDCPWQRTLTVGRRRFGRHDPNSSGDGISLTSNINPSFHQHTIQNTSGSGYQRIAVTGSHQERKRSTTLQRRPWVARTDGISRSTDSTTNPNVPARHDYEQHIDETRAFPASTFRTTPARLRMRTSPATPDQVWHRSPRRNG